ncbi:hypothetical protein FH972_017551 [Carpinus fangiana]|uniref:Uncharacterized protein n=1 Tax=Carpinus fangiana TaxID=176857 RepID=A0A5N6RN69_9ROSI|nr:hypothetical protein FH972_017551 [Carpinus fangiana]
MDEEAWALAYGEDFSPEYSPSPSLYMDEKALAPEFEDNSLATAFPSPPPSEIESGDYYSPLEAPALAPSTAVLAMGSNTETSPVLSPVTPFIYSAEDDAAVAFEPESEGSSGRSEGNMTGYIIAVVCLVGLGGFLHEKRKAKKKSQEYKYYDLAKREEP